MTNLTDLTTKTPASEIRKVAQSYGLVLVGNASYKGVKEQWIQQINDEVAAQQQEPRKYDDFEITLSLVAYNHTMKTDPAVDYVAEKLGLSKSYISCKLEGLSSDFGYINSKSELTREGAKFMNSTLRDHSKYACIIDDEIVDVLTYDEYNNSSTPHPTFFMNSNRYKRYVALNDQNIDPYFLDILSDSAIAEILKFWESYYSIL